jgi:methylmalonyl-CoA mutase N-terminal domain/subunit
MIEFCAEQATRWHPVSISGYHIREAGSTAAQELAFTLADGIGYVQAAVARGLAVDSFAPRLSFFFNVHSDFLEEIAKYRAARRMWATIMRDRFGATDPRSLLMRTHAQTAGCSLTAQQPLNNIVRVAIQALAGVLGGTQSMHTNSMDETLALPSEQAAEIALRTQQVIMEETGVVNVADPLGGSWYVEALTDKLDAEAEAIFAQILDLGRGSSDPHHAVGPMTSGILKGIESGWFTGHIAEAAFIYQRALETGQKRIVGVNCHTDSIGKDLEILRIGLDVERDQVRALAQRRAARDEDEVQRLLRILGETASGDGNLVEPMLAAARAEATLGEICGVLRGVWGGYTENAAF